MICLKTVSSLTTIFFTVFAYAGAFDQDLSSWKTGAVTTMNYSKL